jgi:hypothetical protein
MKVDYKLQAEAIYQQNKANGWHKRDRPYNEIVGLINTETTEALEAERADRYAEASDVLTMYNSLMTYKSFAPGIFKEKIKDTFQDEIADVYIRTQDMCGLKGIFKGINEVKLAHMDLNTHNFDNYWCFWRKLVTSNMDQSVSLNSAIWLLSWCESIANAYGFNLQHHVALKLAYNATRPAKHGKKF